MGKQKNESFQALRGIAFLSVFLSHCGYGKYGLWGVTVFFVMSGMLLVMSNFSKTLDKSPGKCLTYSVSKIKRLYPLHIIMLIVAAVIDLIQAVEQYNLPIESLPKVALKLFAIPIVPNLLLIQSWFPDDMIFLGFNGVAWFLSDCLFLYMIFPPLLSVIKKFKKRNSVIMASVGLILLEAFVSYVLYSVNYNPQAEETIWYWGVYINPLMRAVDFIIGCNMGWLFINSDKEKDSSKLVMTIVEIIGFGLIILAHGTLLKPGLSRAGADYWWVNIPMVFTVGSVFVVSVFAINKGIVTRLLTNRGLIFIGDISAFAFLIHQPVVEIVKLIPIKLQEVAANAVGAVISFVLTVGLSLLYKKTDGYIFKKKKAK